MTESPAGPLVIAHVSDLHLGAHSADAVESLAADVAAAGPVLTVVTGDVTMRARTPQFRAARALLDRLPAPLLVVPGNHDVPLVSAARLVAPYARYRRWIGAELDPVVRLPGLVAVGLQSTPRWRWKSGRVSRRQSELVASELAAAPATAVRLVALHHPPRSAGLARIAGRRGLFRALAAGGADLVLAGHTHLPAAGPVEVPGTAHRLIEVVAGTATSLRTRGVGRCWTVIRIDAETVGVQERHEGPDGWYAGPPADYPRRP
jgi:3',5'-cyclic AMP phosphodiesterase CpdA